MKESFQQECITILNVNEPNSLAFKYMKQKLIEWKGENDKSKITAGDFSMPLSGFSRTSEQNIIQDEKDINNSKTT